MNVSQIKEGALVSYGTSGVCRVGGLRRMRVSDAMPEKLYFELRPARDGGQSVFVPADSERLCAKMRRVMTKEEVDALLDSVAGTSPVWEEDKRAREDKFHRILASGVSAELVLTVCALYLKKQELAGKRRRLSSNDDRVLKAAERLIEDEIAFAADISPSEVPAYIRGRIGTDT